MTSKLDGRGTAPGVAVGPAFLVVAPKVPAIVDERDGSPDDEKDRLNDALARAATQLTEIADRVSVEVGADEGEIFGAHASFANDPELRAQAESAIDEGASAERAVIDSFDEFRSLLTASESEYLSARAEDLTDVRDRVVAILQGVAGDAPAPTEPSVIIAETLTPSQTAQIPRRMILAIATQTGSPTSHAAILARALGVPAVVAVPGLVDSVTAGAVVAVDGGEGLVWVDPTDEERDRFEGLAREAAARRHALEEIRDVPGATADGKHIELAANIGSIEDLALAVEAGAEGSGLVRTEFLFIDRDRAPTVEEQVAFYQQVAAAFVGHRVVFRTLDVGADKPLAFVEREPEENPALGVRGIRLSLQRQELFRDQLRALLRVAAMDDVGRVAIMFPLVSLPSELKQAREIVNEVAEAEGTTLDGVEIGAMVEVPIAALAANRLAAHADFLSVGTNDLVQYLFAADRLVGGIAHLTDPCEPEVLRLLGSVADAGHRNGAWVGVCGEAANDPAFAAALVGLGIDELSMTGPAIPEIKDTLRRLTTDQCRAAVSRAMEADDATAARAVLEQALEV
jgi:phosphoenolpyruvate-protein phosphotransferase (PTS system enzyme I)